MVKLLTQLGMQREPMLVELETVASDFFLQQYPLFGKIIQQKAVVSGVILSSININGHHLTNNNTKNLKYLQQITPNSTDKQI